MTVSHPESKCPPTRSEHPVIPPCQGGQPHKGLIHSENCRLLPTASAARERTNWAEATILIALLKTLAYFTPTLGSEQKSHLALGCCLRDQTLQNVGKQTWSFLNTPPLPPALYPTSSCTHLLATGIPIPLAHLHS